MPGDRTRPTRRFGKNLLLPLALAVALPLGGAAAVWHTELADLPATLLIRDDRPAPPAAEYIVLLMGDDRAPLRASTACKAYKDHLGAHILIAAEKTVGFVRLGLQTNVDDATVKYLELCGVPSADISLLRSCATDSTADEARCVATHFRMHGKADRIVVITSWYHTSRAGYLFGRAMAPLGVEVDMLPAIGPESHPHLWWKEKFVVISMVYEYIKWSYWLVRGDPE
jgi:uncharacterized SAM-binding protein YcdF (DUF218 family)